MKHLWAVAGLLAFVGTAFWFNAVRHTGGSAHGTQKEATAGARNVGGQKESLERLRSIAYLERYIEEVINKGSSQNLGFAYGDMPAGMADAEAAPKIAAYVVSLAGLEPSHPEWVKEGRLFYISNCGGCHGEDGKGVHGTFPDLTRVPLLGIAKRIEAAQRAERRMEMGR